MKVLEVQELGFRAFLPRLTHRLEGLQGLFVGAPMVRAAGEKLREGHWFKAPAGLLPLMHPKQDHNLLI